MNINKNLAAFFNVPSENNVPKTVNGGTFDSQNFQKDYELVQSNFKNLIGTGNLALESALKVATQSDSPRALS